MPHIRPPFLQLEVQPNFEVEIKFETKPVLVGYPTHRLSAIFPKISLPVEQHTSPDSLATAPPKHPSLKAYGRHVSLTPSVPHPKA